jgi:hypothetical protein
MLKDFNKDDVYYLTSKPDFEKRQFGWYCHDDDKNITWKYINFIYNMDINNYDWYIFFDDDTFVFENRLTNLLKDYDPNECYYIGKELDHIKDTHCLYMSGGGGYAISNKLYNLIYQYVRINGIQSSFKHWCDDLCIGFWIQEISKENKVYQINNDLFHIGLHDTESELETAITFHKVMNREQYDFYYSIYEKEVNRQKNINSYTDTTIIKEDINLLRNEFNVINNELNIIIEKINNLKHKINNIM